MMNFAQRGENGQNWPKLVFKRAVTSFFLQNFAKRIRYSKSVYQIASEKSVEQNLEAKSLKRQPYSRELL